MGLTEGLIIIAIVLLLCVTSSKLLYRFGVPTLLIFMVLGMVFGSDGLVGIEFDNYELARKICSVGLIFIMFYGGFGTSWRTAKPVIGPAVCMSTLGVVITAGLTGVFCHLILHCSWLEGLLIGSVVASTDAASVFAILRSRKLNLKGGLAPLLEVESGSNDPFAYMLTMIMVMLIKGEGAGSIPLMLILQLAVGPSIGFGFAKLAAMVLRRINLEIDGLYPIFVTAVVVLGYALSEYLGGNGYLCVYIIGIVLGNSRIMHKRSLVHFFDGISWVMQIMLFFTLGLLAFPSQMPQIIIPGILVSIFMIVVARPLATFSILSWFKIPFKQQLLVSWVGLRGAASIVFAIYAVANHAPLKGDIFHMVFFVALFSVAVQGTLIPRMAKTLGLVEKESSVFKTFTDYQEENQTKLLEYRIHPHSPWANKTIIEAEIPEEILVVMVKRGRDVVVPKGSTLIKVGDTLVLSGQNFKVLRNLRQDKQHKPPKDTSPSIGEGG